MRYVVGSLIGALWLGGCRSVPEWLRDAPLIGIQIRDDDGRQLYLPTAPKRVAIAVPEAYPLWEKAGLSEYIVAACYGSGENPRVFFLLCEDSIALSEALYRSSAEWVWVSNPAQVAGLSGVKVYVYHPDSPEAWLRHLRLLGEVYDRQALIQVADSFARILHQYAELLRQTRRLRVMAIPPEGEGRLCTRYHPLARLIERAGGVLPYGSGDRQPATVLPRESIAVALPEVILLPEGGQELINHTLNLYPELYNSPAIQYKRIFSLPAEVFRQPYTEPLQTLYTLLYVLHPEVVRADTSTSS